MTMDSQNKQKLLPNKEGKTNKEIKKLLHANHKKARKRLGCGNNGEKQNIGLTPGERCLNIASPNYDDLRSEESIRELLTRLEVQKIDIACIQETQCNINHIWE